jgi:haloalkane dehalogenase
MEAQEAVRTPDSRFEGIEDFPWAPNYRDWNGLRLAHVDEGRGSPVVMLHGEPTWGYLWRKVMPPLLEAGHRCVVPDLPGFGRSDKPVDDGWYSFERHAASVVDLLDQLDLSGTTIVVHDWGGPIGLWVAAVGAPERIDRVVAMNTGMFNGHQQMSDNWLHFRDFVASNHDLPIEPLIQGATVTDLDESTVAAYTAPFPGPEYKAGARAFPPMIPMSPDAAGAAEGQATMDFFQQDDRPSLLLWGDSDPALPLDPVGRLVQALFPTAGPLTVIEGASHFLQEDRGEHIGRIIADWIADGSG